MFIEKGIKGMIERQKRNNYTYKLDGDAEAKVVALKTKSSLGN